jgi:hypothetical protein
MAQHKKRLIAKRDRNDGRNKRHKVGEQGISSDEDPSPEPSWSGDVASTAVDWSNMSGRPRLCRSVVPRCRRRAGHGRRGATRLWGRARVRRPTCPSGPSIDPLPYGTQRDGHSRATKICAPSDRSP